MRGMLVQAGEIAEAGDAVIFDCRFALGDPGAGRRDYLQGHIPGAHYLDLETDLSAPVGRHGGRHPLPAAEHFARTLARFGVGLDTPVIVYDDSRLAFAARLWWMMRSLGYRPPRLLDGGYGAWLATGGRPEPGVPAVSSIAAPAVVDYRGLCDITGLRVRQSAGAALVDSREERRYRGLEEPIDPVAGHIPGAFNRPWQGVTGGDGRVRDRAGQLAHWGTLAGEEGLVVYCGSGVTACVNLFSLALLGCEDAVLYGGSWSDWCSYLEVDAG